MKFFSIIFCFFSLSCSYESKPDTHKDLVTDTVQTIAPPVNSSRAVFIQTNTIQPEQITEYAKTLTGIPYKYASTNPQQGFDCSGFITYVFNHFNIDVPRASVGFTNVYHEVPLNMAKQSDLILFTGTNSTEKVVGHMGIIVSNNNDTIAFIHSTSGKANGVTITPLNDYYKSRFVKIVRVFPQNDRKK